MSKTCRDILKDLYGRHVRIGFKRGSGFFYCNKVTEKSEDEIRKEQEKYITFFKNRYEAVKIDLDIFVKNGFNVYVDRIHRRSDYFKKLSISQLKKRYNKLLETKKKYAKISYERMIFTSKIDPDFILNAEYVESYPSIDPEEPGVIIILLDGDYDGRYWNEAEYLKSPRTKVNNFDEEASISLACAILNSAVKACDKKFFYSEEFDKYMPGHSGPDIWDQLLKKGLVQENFKSSYPYL